MGAVIMPKMTLSTRIGLAQMSMRADPLENIDKARRMVQKAADRGASIVCLPELFNARYFAQFEDEPGAADAAEAVPGKLTGELGDIAAAEKVVLVGGSVYERDGRMLYNTSTIFEKDGRLVGKYRKMHVPHDHSYYEQNYFRPGDLGFQVADTSAGRISALICYDQWFPEAARAVALMGADVVFYPTAIGHVRGVLETEGDWHRAWESVMRGHAICNGIPVAAVNRCGVEGDMEFWGGSFIMDAFGNAQANARGTERVLIGEVHPLHTEAVREGWGFFRNRRPEDYRILTDAGMGADR
jgi:agmatine deiminase